MAQEEDDTLKATGVHVPPDPYGDGVGDFPGRNIIPLFYNNFYTVVTQQTTRITFGETVFVGQLPNWSASLIMQTEVAVDMAQKILKLARDQGFLKDEKEEPDVLG